MRRKIIEIAHESHQGVNRTSDQISLDFWWPSCERDIKDYINACATCAASKKTAKFFSASDVPTETPVSPWHTLGIDIIGPMSYLPPAQRYGFTVMDYFSKFPCVFFLPNVETFRIIHILSELFASEGLPVRIVSDNGPQFTSSQFAQFLDGHNITHRQTPVFHAKANGLIERFNRTLKSQLQIAISHGIKWNAYIQKFLSNYRSTPHAHTGLTPSSMLHGRHMRTNRNNFIPSMSETPIREQTPDIQRMQRRTETFRKVKYIHPRYSHGERVRALLPNGKTVMKTIVNRLGPHTYRLDDGYLWHVSRIAKLRGTGSMTTSPGNPARSRNAPRYPHRNVAPPDRYILQQ